MQRKIRFGIQAIISKALISLQFIAATKLPKEHWQVEPALQLLGMTNWLKRLKISLSPVVLLICGTFQGTHEAPRRVPHYNEYVNIIKLRWVKFNKPHTGKNSSSVI